VRRRLEHKLLMGVAAIAVLAGVTAAVVSAAQPAAHHPAAHRRNGGALATAAGYLGVSPAQLRGQLRSGKSLAEIADATGGRSQAGLIAALDAAGRQRLTEAGASLPSRVTAEVDRAGGLAGARTRHRGRGLSAAASYLGVSPAQLRADLRSGKTLAQVANATGGRSQAGLVEALVAARKATLSSRVAAGAITQAQADAALPHLVKRITAQVNRARGRHGAHAHAAARLRG